MQVAGSRDGLLVCPVVVLILLGTLHADDDQSKTRRTPWTTSRFQGTPEPPPPFQAQRVFPNISFHQPTVITSAPGTDRFFVAQHDGKVFSFAGDQDVKQADLFLDVADLVEQLNDAGEDVRYVATYGMTFHPNFAENRYCYVCYVVQHAAGGKGQHPDGTRVVRLTVSDSDPPVADPQTEVPIITWLQGGHNGGCLKFGLDGKLFISTGDGGFAFPPDGRNSGQDVSNLLSAVLRIDVDQPRPDTHYSIPSDNPFVDLEGARGEIWAYGMRNPWKISVDRKNGDLWAGDVGWESWELVYRVKPGDNYGWSLVEGPQPVHAERERGPTPIVPAAVLIPHTDGASVTGGFVYRGRKFPELDGTYIFGDWETRRIWGVTRDGDKVSPMKELVEPTVRIVGFAEDHDGELYLLDYDDGTIHTLIRSQREKPKFPFPRQLSETGLFSSVSNHQLATGVVPFEINAELWSDHSTADRFIAIPGSDPVGVHTSRVRVAGSMFQRQMDFPKDTVLGKTLSLPGVVRDGSSTTRRIETQVLHYDGQFWRGYSYVWNDDQTDAELVPASGMRSEIPIAADAPGGARSHEWKFHSRYECLRCHNPWSEYTLAFNVPQLNRVDYRRIRSLVGSGDGKAVVEDTVGELQLEQFRTSGLIRDIPQEPDPDNPFDKGKPPLPADELPRLHGRLDPDASLDQRARSYLHVNCAHCHQNGGGGSAYLHLGHQLKLSDTRALGRRPTQGTFAIHDAELLAPGDPYRSVVYFRMAKTGSGRMPHIGSKLVDADGLKLIHDWIRQLPVRDDDEQLIRDLLALHEPTVLQKEAENRDLSIFNLARRVATENEREDDVPNDADKAEAVKRYEEAAAARSETRAKKRADLIENLLGDPSLAILLVRELREDRLPDTIRDQVLAAAADHSQQQIRDLYEVFLPEEMRSKRLGDVINPQELLALNGNAGRGRTLFFEAQGVQCRNCHRVGGKGKSLGPDLDGIAKKNSKAKILDSILSPSRNIDPKFAAWLVETTAGRVHIGLLTSKTDDEVVLRTTEGKEIRIAADDVEEMFPQRKSLMPDLQLRDLTAEQVADLLAFLASLK